MAIPSAKEIGFTAVKVLGATALIIYYNIQIIIIIDEYYYNK